jgi:hypothetical protein
MQLKQAETEYRIREMQVEVELKRQLMDVEFQYNMQLKGMEGDVIKDRDMEKEKAKDKRVDLQATRQSDLINQRQNNLPPKNFESQDDSLDGFSLESFGPR